MGFWNKVESTAVKVYDRVTNYAKENPGKTAVAAVTTGATAFGFFKGAWDTARAATGGTVPPIA